MTSSAPSTTTAHTGPTVRATVLYGAGEFALRASELVLLPVYTRFLSLADYGVVELTRPIIAVWALICAAGLPDAIVRQQLEHRTLEGAHRFITTVVVGSAILAGTLTSAIWLFGQATGVMLTGLHFDPYISLALLTGAGLALPLMLLAHLQAAGRPALYALVQVVQGLLSVAVVTYFVAFSFGGAVGQLLGRLSVAAVLTIVAAIAVLRGGQIVFDVVIFRRALVFGLPVLAHSLFWLVLQYSDRIILQHFVGLQDVGVYALGYNVALSVGIAVALYNRAWVPRLYEGLTSGVLAPLDLMRSTSRSVAFALLVGVVIAVYAPEAIGVLAPVNYAHAADVLVVLALGNVFLALYQASTNLIWQRQKTLYSAGITAVAAVTNVLLNLLLVPRFGIQGAAWATALSLGLYAGIATVVSHRLHGISYEPRRLLMLAAIGLGVYTVAQFPTLDGWERLAWKAAACLAYGLAAWAIAFPRWISR